MPPAAHVIHLSLGQSSSFSVFKNPLLTLRGADGSSWNLEQAGFIFSITIALLGISAAIFGAWLEGVGSRRAMFYTALCFASGFYVAPYGATIHSLALLYLGYGVIGGIGLGLGYISPVSTLIKWFPDRPGTLDHYISNSVPKQQAYPVILHIVSGLLIIGLLANLFVRPAELIQNRKHGNAEAYKALPFCCAFLLIWVAPRIGTLCQTSPIRPRRITHAFRYPYHSICPWIGRSPLCHRPPHPRLSPPHRSRTAARQTLINSD